MTSDGESTKKRIVVTHNLHRIAALEEPNVAKCFSFVACAAARLCQQLKHRFHAVHRTYILPSMQANLHEMNVVAWKSTHDTSCLWGILHRGTLFRHEVVLYLEPHSAQPWGRFPPLW
jgi:hypothetical protein